MMEGMGRPRYKMHTQAQGTGRAPNHLFRPRPDLQISAALEEEKVPRKLKPPATGLHTARLLPSRPAHGIILPAPAWGLDLLPSITRDQPGPPPPQPLCPEGALGARCAHSSWLPPTYLPPAHLLVLEGPNLTLSPTLSLGPAPISSSRGPAHTTSATYLLQPPSPSRLHFTSELVPKSLPEARSSICSYSCP